MNTPEAAPSMREYDFFKIMVGYLKAHVTIDETRELNSSDPTSKIFEVAIRFWDTDQNNDRFQKGMQAVRMLQPPGRIIMSNPNPAFPTLIVRGLTLTEKELEELKKNANI